MSLVFEGRIHTFSPVTYLDRTDLTLIRPLIYVNECDVKGFSNIYELPVFKNPCPADGETKREDASRWIKNLNEEAPGVRDRLFHAIKAGVIPQWRLSQCTDSDPDSETDEQTKEESNTI